MQSEHIRGRHDPAWVGDRAIWIPDAEPEDEPEEHYDDRADRMREEAESRAEEIDAN